MKQWKTFLLLVVLAGAIMLSLKCYASTLPSYHSNDQWKSATAILNSGNVSGQTFSHSNQTQDGVSMTVTGLEEDRATSSSPMISNMDHTTITTGQQSARISDFRLCRATTTSQYYCSGPEYEQFADRLEDFVLNKHINQSSFWGRRPSPVPPNTTILLLGNSHTRQLFFSLACQYRNETVSLEKTPANNAHVATLTLWNGARVHSITNHWLVYGNDWPRLVLHELNLTSWNQIDAVVLGRFNNMKNAQGTSFAKWLETEMMRIVSSGNSSLAEPSFSLAAHPPPNLWQVADKYNGPIVVAGMFAAYSKSHFVAQQRHARGLIVHRNRTNIALVNGRTYMKALGECGTNEINGGICLLKPDDTNKKGRLAKDMHRCVGHRGAHPSLIVWDVLEELHKLLL
jgi:hypothetical protein